MPCSNLPASTQLRATLRSRASPWLAPIRIPLVRVTAFPSPYRIWSSIKRPPPASAGITAQVELMASPLSAGTGAAVVLVQAPERGAEAAGELDLVPRTAVRERAVATA